MYLTPEEPSSIIINNRCALCLTKQLFIEATTMSTEQNHALQNAIAGMASITAMVAALECDYDRLEELRDEAKAIREDILSMPENEGLDIANLMRNHPLFSSEEYDELAKLEEAANGNSDEYEARQAIQEDPLSIDVRSAWQSLGETLTAAEFCILLGTGGPALRIVGELDHYMNADRPRLEYQDWGTPWTELVDGVDRDALLTYCNQFYFGE